MNETYIKTLDDYSHFCSKHKDFVYRGFDNIDYYGAKPSIIFKDKTNAFLGIQTEMEQMQTLLKFKTDLFDSFTVIEIARHYDFPCRITDFTSDPLVALYFACKKGDTDAAIICTDKTKYMEQYKKRDNQVSDFSNEELFYMLANNLENDFIGGNLPFRNNKYYSFKEPIFITPEVEDTKMGAQQSVFLLWCDLVDEDTYDELIKKYSDKIIIKKEFKGQLMEELQKMGYTKETIENVDTSLFESQEQLQKFKDTIEDLKLQFFGLNINNNKY